MEREPMKARRLHTDVTVALAVLAFCAGVFALTFTFDTVPAALAVGMGPAAFPAAAPCRNGAPRPHPRRDGSWARRGGPRAGAADGLPDRRGDDRLHGVARDRRHGCGDDRRHRRYGPCGASGAGRCSSRAASASRSRSTASSPRCSASRYRAALSAIGFSKGRAMSGFAAGWRCFSIPTCCG